MNNIVEEAFNDEIQKLAISSKALAKMRKALVKSRGSSVPKEITEKTNKQLSEYFATRNPGQILRELLKKKNTRAGYRDLKKRSLI